LPKRNLTQNPIKKIPRATVNLASIAYDRFQSLPDFHTPFIVDDALDSSVIIGEQFASQFQEGLEAKPGQLFSMSGYERVGPTGLMDLPAQSAVHNPMIYDAFPQGNYDHHPLLHPNGARLVQDADLQFATGNEGYENAKSMLMNIQEDGVSQLRNYSPPHSRVPSASSVLSNPRKRKASSVDSFDNMPAQPKRKASSVEEFDMLPIHKRPMVAQVHVQDPNGDYYDLSGQTSPYSQFVPTPTGSTGIPAYTTHGSSPRSGHHYSTSNTSQVSLAAPSPHTPAFSPSFTTVKSEQSPGAPMTPLARPGSTNSPMKSSLPQLVRTSTMQQSPPTVMSSIVAGQTQTFNPYAMYPLKASLKLKGDLETMKQNWTADERESRRRLVEFKRNQSNCTINAEFAPVTPQDRVSGSICISCIWWKEKNEFFVTSVDTIYLLEALVGVRFTVEEKNRIRRNLEGFRPMTVSKAKTDSEEFFKVIMGFPHPKPRNIEKDVKVFPWKILSTALKKIISKYSASYSSTAAAILTPPSGNYVHPEGTIDYYDISPRTDYVPSGGPQYALPHDMRYVSGPAPLRMPQMAPAPGPHELQLQMPEYAPAYTVNGQYPYQTLNQIPQSSMAMTPHPMTAPVTRMPSWGEFANFADDSPVTMAPQSAPPTAYPRGPMEMGGYVPPMHYQYN